MSEPWAVNAGKASTAIGTATIESDDNLLTIADHGLGDGDTVTVDTLTGGGSALTADAVYFVRDATTNDFALSLTLHGPQVEFATDGGADVYHFAPQYNAAQLRRLNAGLMFGGTSDAFGVRQGVRPGHVPLSVSGTTWTVEDLTGAVYPGLSSDDGGYPVAHQSESGSLDPADGSNDRIDALDLQIQDDDTDASGFRRARVVYVDGTPGADPDPPSVTSNALRLGTILVPSGGSPSPSIDTLAQWTVASGGVPPVRDDTERPSAGRYQGMLVYRQDTDTLEVWDGSAWSPLASVASRWEDITPAGGSLIASATNFPITAGRYDMIRVRLRGALDGSGLVSLRINDDATAGLHRNSRVEFSGDSSVLVGNSTNEVTAWWVAAWSTGSNNVAEATIFDTAGDTALSFNGWGYRASATAGNREHTLSGGDLSGTRQLDSIRVMGIVANLASTRVWIEGHLAS